MVVMVCVAVVVCVAVLVRVAAVQVRKVNNYDVNNHAIVSRSPSQ